MVGVHGQARGLPPDWRAAASGERFRAPPAAEADAVAALLRDRRRRKIWDLAPSLHCSVIGTCLTTAELRHLLIRLEQGGAASASDHDLHGQGVLLARQHDLAGKLLNKALERRHRVAIHQFAKAEGEAAVRDLWHEAVKRGDIPGAYWAALTHPDTGEGLLRQVFGEVHMLSHLVGAANRADIRRLHQLEAENAALAAKAERQQARLHETARRHEAEMRALADALARREETARPVESPPAGEAESAALARRLAAEAARRERAERRAAALAEALRERDAALGAAAAERDALGAELAAAEENLEALLAAESAAGPGDLDGLAVLYIGGRPPQVARLRALSQRAAARFLHHDGGIDERSGLLPGLISRADIALFPVDCVSHEAALMVKRLCRQAGKPWLPLRTASITAFLAAFAPMRRAVAEARGVVAAAE
jgi:hypothetical protein